MRVFVTGATGFIGSHVAERLHAAGHRLRALARPGSDVTGLRRLGAELVEGDLGDPRDLAPSLHGVDAVVHNAALVADWGRWSDFHRVAVAGTRALADASARAGVGRFVHMSSASVYGLRRIRGRHVTEDLAPPRRPWRWDYYGRSKIASERVVAAYGERAGLAAVILRPTLVYGPRDRAVVPRLARLLCAGRLRLVGRGANRMHLIYVSDVAEAALRALETATAVGGTYHLDGPGDLTQRAFLDAVADLAGAPRPRPGPPLYPAYALGFLAEIAGRARGAADPPVRTRYQVALLGGEAHFDTTRAERELGWKAQVTGSEGLARTRRHARAAA